MAMYNMADLQYQAMYYVLSFSITSMMVATMYIWFRASPGVKDQHRSAAYTSGLVTFIAAYRHIWIFNS